MDRSYISYILYDTHLLEELLSKGQSAMISTCPVEFQNNKPLDFVTSFKIIVEMAPSASGIQPIAPPRDSPVLVARCSRCYITSSTPLFSLLASSYRIKLSMRSTRSQHSHSLCVLKRGWRGSYEKHLGHYD